MRKIARLKPYSYIDLDIKELEKLTQSVIQREELIAREEQRKQAKQKGESYQIKPFGYISSKEALDLVANQFGEERLRVSMMPSYVPTEEDYLFKPQQAYTCSDTGVRFYQIVYNVPKRDRFGTEEGTYKILEVDTTGAGYKFELEDEWKKWD